VPIQDLPSRVDIPISFLRERCNLITEDRIEKVEVTINAEDKLSRLQRKKLFLWENDRANFHAKEDEGLRLSLKNNKEDSVIAGFYVRARVEDSMGTLTV